jgi:hypothetical protein
MQAALQVFKGRGEGKIHKLLKSACLLTLEGARVEVKFENGIADIMFEDTVIECLSKPTYSQVKRKLVKYSKTRSVIFAVPADSKPYPFVVLECAVWFVDMETGGLTKKDFSSLDHLSEAARIRTAFVEEMAEKIFQNAKNHGMSFMSRCGEVTHQIEEKIRFSSQDVELIEKHRDFIESDLGMWKYSKYPGTPENALSYAAMAKRLLLDVTALLAKKVQEENAYRFKGEVVSIPQRDSAPKLPQYVWAPSVHTNQHLDATCTAMGLGGEKEKNDNELLPFQRRDQRIYGRRANCTHTLLT